VSISDIDPNTPSGQDQVLNGDNQIRDLKADIVESLGGLDGPVYEDSDSSGSGGTTPVTAATMSSWEARINALEAQGSSPAGTSIPVGGIMIWHGDLATIPTGFRQCNGGSYRYTLPGGGTAVIATPDLRGRFVVGPGATNGPTWNFGLAPYWVTGSYGPQLNRETATAGNHNHTTVTPGTALTTSQIPSHYHGIFGNTDSGSDLSNLFQAAARTSTTGGYTIRTASGTAQYGATSTAGSGASHTHPNSVSSTAGSHTHIGDSTPPYLGLYYIMYVADGVPV